MKFWVWTLIILGLLGCSKEKHPNIFIQIHDLDEASPRIILMHPTVRNIKTLLYLTDRSIFPLDSEYQIVGVFHGLEEYNYNQSAKFIQSEHLDRVNLLKVKERLSSDSLYTDNHCRVNFRELFEKSNGILFMGGPDIPPATYGKPTNLLTAISDLHRHYLEISFLYHLLGGYQDTAQHVPFLNENPDYVVLGICLGMQSMNVASGGTLIQDIPTELYGLTLVEQVLALEPHSRHRNYHSNYGLEKGLTPAAFHKIKYEQGTLFDSLNSYSTSFPHVWSNHHQCIDVLGKGFVPIAWSLDGMIVEAVAHSDYPNVLGVQFHPEATALYDAGEKIKLIPGQKENNSYPSMYADHEGEIFHRSFWQYLGKLF